MTSNELKPSLQKAAHPRGLYVLFFAEAWERFSYYGMRALLVLYMVKHLDLERSSALGVYAAYTGLVYLTPIFGGLIADRLLGSRKCIIIGGSVMALGHLTMAFESLLYPALGLLVVGNGFFKPNISTIVGGLYEENDPRRDGGFTIFYMGINLGALFAPLVCGWLGENVGWHWGFSAAAVGMVLGLITFVTGSRLLGKAGYPPDMVDPTPGTPLRTKDWMDIAIWTVGASVLVWIVLWVWGFIGPVFDSIPAPAKLGLAVVFVLGAIGAPVANAAKDGAEAWQRTAVIVILGFFVIFFWMGFEQAGGTMTLFADQQTDRHVGGWEVPASLLQAVNPTFILLLAPLFSMMWLRWDRSPRAISTPAKLALGMIILGLGFALMYMAQLVYEQTGQPVGLQWLIGVYFLHTVGELCLSPLGLSLVTKLALPRMVSLMMGVWFGATAVANYCAGRMEELVSHYELPLFGVLVGTSIGAGLVLLCITPLLKKWMHGRA